MEGKLIKLGLSEGYRLDDLNGNYIASTLNGKNKISLRNCEEIELGFSLVELFDKVDRSIDYHEFDFSSFRLGVKAVLELLDDKKFSDDDVRKAIEFGMKSYHSWYDRNEDEFIQSLQQTEWEVSFNPDEKDSEGCLILKRKI